MILIIFNSITWIKTDSSLFIPLPTIFPTAFPQNNLLRNAVLQF